MPTGIRFPDEMVGMTTLDENSKILVSDATEAKKAKWWSLAALKTWFDGIFANKDASNLDAANTSSWQELLGIVWRTPKTNVTSGNCALLATNQLIATSNLTSNLPTGAFSKIGILQVILLGESAPNVARQLHYYTKNADKLEHWFRAFDGTTWNAWSMLPNTVGEGHRIQDTDNDTFVDVELGSDTDIVWSRSAKTGANSIAIWSNGNDEEKVTMYADGGFELNFVSPTASYLRWYSTGMLDLHVASNYPETILRAGYAIYNTARLNAIGKFWGRHFHTVPANAATSYLPHDPSFRASNFWSITNQPAIAFENAVVLDVNVNTVQGFLDNYHTVGAPIIGRYFAFSAVAKPVGGSIDMYYAFYAEDPGIPISDKFGVIIPAGFRSGFGVTSPIDTIEIAGTMKTQGIRTGFEIITANTTLGKTHNYVYLDSTTAPFTITLPQIEAGVAGQHYWVRKFKGTYKVRLQTHAADTLEKFGTFAEFDANSQYLEIVADNMNKVWRLLSRND